MALYSYKAPAGAAGILPVHYLRGERVRSSVSSAGGFEKLALPSGRHERDEIGPMARRDNGSLLDIGQYLLMHQALFGDETA